MLRYLIPSKTRRKILDLFFSDTSGIYHLRKISRLVDEEVNAVKRELDILEKAAVLKKERRVNKVIYELNRDWFFFDEFLRLFTKSGTLVQSIRKNLPKLGKVKFIALSTKFSKKKKIAEGEIYLLVVGIVVLPEVAQIIAEEEKKFPYEINYTIMTEEELLFRKKNSDPFIWKFLRESKIMIKGEEEQLLA